MFGISLNQNTDSETKISKDANPNGAIDGNLINADLIKNKPKSIFTSDAERNAANDDALKNQEDDINQELRDSLTNDDSIDSKAEKILSAERKKDTLGLDRFYSKAIQSIGDFKNTLPDTDAQLRKSLSQLQKELKKEKQLCCNDCD